MQLRLRGLSWLELARRIEVSSQAVQQTAAGRPSIPIERALADQLGVEPEELFPEHWSPTGERIPKERAALHRAKNTRFATSHHVEKKGAA
ncbi:lambda repressor-like predicted transcriptional regulator [Ancylobacter sp. 3268]|uniref:helix-turn-helix domain-containing protein n=1 Tax=Ancylobacter sp. 3268 TaxID=2817752 RepID=UPI00285AFD76|nr:helix-turn-helix domain-containing protein [Ancylobacter sp. 3268]MDR6952640.1 lambda repressor-like predicted transcriptional regulator [Ancylobacter sp. 3268]